MDRRVLFTVVLLNFLPLGVAAQDAKEPVDYPSIASPVSPQIPPATMQDLSSHEPDVDSIPSIPSPSVTFDSVPVITTRTIQPAVLPNGQVGLVPHIVPTVAPQQVVPNSAAFPSEPTQTFEREQAGGRVPPPLGVEQPSTPVPSPQRPFVFGQSSTPIQIQPTLNQQTPYEFGLSSSPIRAPLTPELLTPNIIEPYRLAPYNFGQSSTPISAPLISQPLTPYVFGKSSTPISSPLNPYQFGKTSTPVGISSSPHGVVSTPQGGTSTPHGTSSTPQGQSSTPRGYR